MLRYIRFLYVLALCGCTFHTPLTVNIVIDDEKEGERILIHMGEEMYVPVYDSAGYYVFRPEGLSVAVPGMLEYGSFVLPLYFEPEKSFEVHIAPSLAAAEFWGEGALKNEIWNGKYNKELPLLEDTLDVYHFTRQVEQLDSLYTNLIDDLNLDPEFSHLVKERFKEELQLRASSYLSEQAISQDSLALSDGHSCME